MGYTGYQNSPIQGPSFGGQPAQPPAGYASPNVQPGAPNTPGAGGMDIGSLLSQFQNLIFNQPNQLQGQYGFDQMFGNMLQQSGLYDWQAGNLEQNAGFQMQGLTLDKQQEAIQQAALGRQGPLMNAEWGLQQQQYGLQNQGFDQAQQQAWQSAGTQRRGLDSSETARGAYGSVGHNQGLGDIQTQLADSLSTIGRERQSAALSQQGAGLQHTEDLAKLQDSQKQLDVMSQRLGLSGDEIQSRLTQSLQSLGLSTVNSSDFLSELGKMQNGEYSPYASMIGDVYAFSGLPLLGGSNG